MRDYQVVQTYAEVDALVKELENGPDVLAFDLETGFTSAETVAKRALNTRHPDFIVVGFSITNSKDWARYIPLRHDNYQPLEPIKVWEKFRKIFETKEIIAHNASFERAALASLYRAGDVERPLEMKRTGHDTMIMANVLGKYKEVGLKALTREVLGESQTEYASLFGAEVMDKSGTKIVASQVKKTRFNHLPVSPEVVNYGCDDSALCMELFEVFYPQLDETLKRIYSVEMQILLLMSQAEEFGVGVDWAGIQEAYNQYLTFRPKFETKVREEFAAMTVDPELKELARHANFGSPKQMRTLLYEGLGMKTTRTSGSGEMSTDAKALEALSRKHEAVRSLLSLREINNMGRRLKKWLDEYSDCFDGRVHPSFNQVRVISGRFAASDPAIQQLPKDWLWSISTEIGEDGKVKFIPEGTQGEDYWSGNFRKFLISAPDKTLLTFDYSQQELRVLAGITGEPTFVKAFAKKEDPHKATASMLFNKSAQDVTKDDRQIGKAQPLDAKILTSTGWVEMGSIKKGDFVIGSSGKPVRVTGVFPQGKKEVFTVKTVDGSVECCEEHLWSVLNNKNKMSTLTTRQILESGLPQTVPSTGRLRSKYFLPERPVVDFSPTEVAIDPYVLGLLLGDGGFTHDGIMFASADPSLNDSVFAESSRLNCRVGSHFSRDGVEGFYIWGTGTKKVGSNPLREALRTYGLEKARSNTKFIPDEYKYGTVETRLAVLQGLFDTDGWVHAVSGADICLSSESMINDLKEIAQSLGGKAYVKSKGVPKRYREDDLYHSRLPAFLLHISFDDGVTNPFRLSRKADKFKFSGVRKLPILDVRSEGVLKEMQCISVDAEDSLYITNDFMLTHNTINFALLYGMGAKSLGEQLALDKEEAEGLIDAYKSRLSKVGQWDAQSRRQGVADGFVTSWFGRKMTLWAASNPDPYIRSGAERLAVNAQIQGGAADYTKLAMIRSWALLRQAGLWGNDKVMLTMNQHDSLTFEVSDDLDMNAVRDILQEAVVFDARKMFPKLQIPVFPRFDVDWELGKTWGGSVPWPLNEDATKTETGWAIGSKEDSVEIQAWSKDETVDTPQVQVVHLAPEAMQVVWTGKTDKAHLEAFIALLKSNPGDTAVYFTMKGRTKNLSIKTSFSGLDANRISFVLGGAEVLERTIAEMEEML